MLTKSYPYFFTLIRGLYRLFIHDFQLWVLSKRILSML